MFNRTYELFLFDVFIAIVKIEKTVDKFDNAQTLLHDYNAWGVSKEAWKKASK